MVGSAIASGEESLYRPMCREDTVTGPPGDLGQAPGTRVERRKNALTNAAANRTIR
jgi:hypothetical protein